MRKGKLAVILVALLALCIGSPVLAKKGGKPGGGGGGGGSTLEGTIWYFSSDVECRSIGADGTGDQLAEPRCGHPSHSLHDGKRWYLRNSTALGVFARSDDDDDVTLHAAATDRQIGSPSAYTMRWSKDDRYASYLLTEWWGTGATDADVSIVRLEIDWTSGEPSVVGAEETVLETSLYNGEPAIRIFDWAPDSEGDKLVYELRGANGLREIRSYDVAAESDSFLSDGIQPEWSPDGTKIAFSDVHIYTINPSGSEKTRIVRNATSPMWAPDSNNIALVAGGLKYVDAGGGKARSIGSVNPVFTFGWR